MPGHTNNHNQQSFLSADQNCLGDNQQSAPSKVPTPGLDTTGGSKTFVRKRARRLRRCQQKKHADSSALVESLRKTKYLGTAHSKRRACPNIFFFGLEVFGPRPKGSNIFLSAHLTSFGGACFFLGGTSAQI